MMRTSWLLFGLSLVVAPRRRRDGGRQRRRPRPRLTDRGESGARWPLLCRLP